MAYDRYDTRDAPRDERSRWSSDRSSGGGRSDERGFFERAGDEIASWFGDDDAERRRNQDQMRDRSDRGWSSRDRDSDRNRMGGMGRDERDRERMSGDRSSGGRDDRDRWSSDRNRDDRERMSSDRNRDQDRGFHDRGWEHGQSRGYATSERDYNPSWRSEFGSDRDHNRDHNRDRDRSRDAERSYGSRSSSADRNRDRGYQPMAGDYGREGNHESQQFFAASGVGRSGGDYSRGQDHDRDRDRNRSEWDRDPYRRTSRAGTSDKSDRSRHEDPHYESWRQRHMSDLDRDYDDYRRENQSRFEDDFGNWRDRRQQKRGILAQVHEHMEVVGNDDKHVGTVDKVAGDRIILTKSDPDSGGAHHSLSCSDIDCVKDGKVRLDCSAEQAKKRWRDESRNRALFERDDQGEMGPRTLNRSFEGTYR